MVFHFCSLVFLGVVLGVASKKDKYSAVFDRNAHNSGALGHSPFSSAPTMTTTITIPIRHNTGSRQQPPGFTTVPLQCVFRHSSSGCSPHSPHTHSHKKINYVNLGSGLLLRVVEGVLRVCEGFKFQSVVSEGCRGREGRHGELKTT